jgi:hypothetical protein
MPRKRPPAVTVFAILNLVFGGLGLLFGSCAGGLQAIGMNAMPPPAAQANDPTLQLQFQLMKEIPHLNEVQLVNLLVIAGLSLGLLVSGLGLLLLQPWGRWLGLLTAAAVIPYALVWIGFQILVYAPAIDRALAVVRPILEANPRTPPGFVAGLGIGVWIGLAINVGLSLVELVYVGILTAVLMSAKTRRAFAGRRREYDDYDDGHEDDSDDRWRDD